MGFSYKKIGKSDLTIFTADGEVTLDGWLKTIEEYNGTGATRLELYDMRRGSGDFSCTDARLLHFETKPETSIRTSDGRTAILVTHPAQYGMARVYVSYAEAGGVPWKVEIFYSADKAAEWLGVDLKGLIPGM